MDRRFRVEFGVLAAVMALATPLYAADGGAAIAGVVRDAKGVPQMGALVQVVGADSTVRAIAYTDMQGHYLVAKLLPGMYAVRASAALFLPASREHLRLAGDHLSNVNLTLSALFEPAAWLPAHVRGADEPADDWSWTLRSAASRPMLKLDDAGALVSVAGAEGQATKKTTAGRLTANSGSKSFGQGGAQVVMTAEHLDPNGTRNLVTADLGQPEQEDARAASFEAASTLERQMGLAGKVATRVEYSSHPEIMGTGTDAGLSVITLTSAERFDLGDLAEVEVGSRVQATRGPANDLVTRPFLRVSAHPTQTLAVTYSLATATDEQDYNAAVFRDADLPAVVNIDGRGFAASGAHQEIAVSRRTAATLVSVAFYADALHRIEVGGNLSVSASDFRGNGTTPVAANMLIDQSNGAVQALIPGYGNAGINLVLQRTVGQDTWVTVQYATGSGMTMDAEGISATGSLPQMHGRRGEAATVSVESRFRQKGTRVRVAYRLEPGVLVTSIDPYDMLSAGNYLSVRLRQSVHLPGGFPRGMEITVDGSNVLEQGYRHVVGSPLYLAASPTSLQAGVAFSF